jgi:hypothetical protein
MKKPVLPALQPEVATRYQLGPTGRTRFYVMQLGREVDLTQLTLEEADALVRLEGSEELLVPIELPKNDVGPSAVTKGPTRARKTKKGA